MDNNDQSADAVFLRFDQLVSQLEDEGYPFAFIIEVMRDYVEIADDYLV
jgi:hypothetical protein